MKIGPLLVIAFLALGGEARADDGSWCVSGFARGPGYGKPASAESTVQDGCAAFLGKKKAWHFHGFVAKSDKCYACWDEESSTCETAAPSKEGYRFLGSNDCGAVTPAAIGDTRQVDPKAPPPKPAAPTKPAKPAR
jgi:hypothetical protein